MTTEFIPYPHLERFGTDEVQGINLGECYIFPKIDGTNASVWSDGHGGVHCGSRTRVLSAEADNAGFYKWVQENAQLQAFTQDFPGYRLYGEWLVPHSLKTYRDDAWRQFYVFDILTPGGWMVYEKLESLCKAYGVPFIPCVAKAYNPTYEQLLAQAEKNTYLLKDGSGAGEGVVLKRYDGWTNGFGRTTWAKLILNTFRDKHITEMGGSVIKNKMVEDEITAEFVTQHLVDKVVAKIRVEKGQFGARDIPQLLGTVFHDLVTEELWEALKKHKDPAVDFKTLRHFTIARVKSLLPELFGVRT
jgi:RNA ligase